MREQRARSYWPVTIASIGATAIGLVVERSVWIFPIAVGFFGAGSLAWLDRMSGTIRTVDVLVALSVVVGAIAFCSAIDPSVATVSRVAVGGLVFAASVFVVAFATRTQAVGGGDVKLAALLGLTLGVVDLVVVGIALGLAMLAWIGHRIVRGPGRSAVFGPALVGVSLVALAFGVILDRAGVPMAFGA